MKNINQIEIVNGCNRFYKFIKKYKNFITEIASKLNLDKDIIIIAASKEKMQRLTIKHLKKDGYSTVLTFNHDCWSEIYISVCNIAEKHKINGINLEDEVARYLIHCLLNVINSQDKDEKYWEILEEYKLI